MTHSTVNTENESVGSTRTVFHTINITSLDSAGVETYDPVAEVGLGGADRYGVSIQGIEDESLVIQWDHLDTELKVKNMSDGTDVANNNDVGEVLLKVEGV